MPSPSFTRVLSQRLTTRVILSEIWRVFLAPNAVEEPVLSVAEGICFSLVLTEGSEGGNRSRTFETGHE